MPVVFAIVSATSLVLVGRALISLNSLDNLVPDTFLLDPVYARQTRWNLALTNQLSRY